MKTSGFIYFLLIAALVNITINTTTTPAIQTYSLSGRILVEGRVTHGQVTVWIDSIGWDGGSLVRFPTTHGTVTDVLGDYVITGLSDGEYMVWAWSVNCLSRIIDTVRVTGGDVSGVDGKMFAGDVAPDGRINLLDAFAVLTAYGTTPDDILWNGTLDLDNNGEIDSLDIVVLIEHWKSSCNVLRPQIPIDVTEPNGSTTLYPGEYAVDIEWDTHNLGGMVMIVLYKGDAPVDTLALSTPNDGFAVTQLPYGLTQGMNYRILVCHEEGSCGFSDHFEILGPTTIEVTEPNSSTQWYPGQQMRRIEWNTGNLGGNVSIYLCRGSTPVDTVTLSTSNGGEQQNYQRYTVPLDLPQGTDYRVLVYFDESRYDYSDYFEILPPRSLIKVTNPHSGSRWLLGEAGVYIQWDHGGLGGYVAIHLYKDQDQVRTISPLSENDGILQVNVPDDLTPGSDYRVYVHFDDLHNDFSDYFEIPQSTNITVIQPDSTTIWYPGQYGVPIEWDHGNLSGEVSIYLYRDDLLIETIVEGIANTGHWDYWEVPEYMQRGTGYRILVARDGSHYGYSDKFMILLPTLYDVCFTDGDTGTAVGAGGTIIRTTDGGVTWTMQESGTEAVLRAVSFVDTYTGTTVGYDGTIVRTTDGGATWTAQESGTGNSLRDVSFVDANTGTAVGSRRTIIRTVDGGASWIAQSPPSSAGYSFSSVSFTDENTGTLVHFWAEEFGYNYSTIHKTTDGGATWVEQTRIKYVGLHDVTFTDENTGTVVGTPNRSVSTYSIYRTTDGGATWTPQGGTTGHQLRGVSFAGANTGTAVGDYGVVLHTTDGGDTWMPQKSSTGHQLFSVCFIDPVTGTAVGYHGTILRTMDGGATWVRQTNIEDSRP